MSWIRIGDEWWRDQRVRTLSHQAVGLLVLMLSRSGELNSFGALTRDDVSMVAGGPARKSLSELTKAGFIEATNDGWRITRPEDYFEHPATVRARRAQRAAAGVVGGIGRARTAERSAGGRFATGGIAGGGYKPDEPSGAASGREPDGGPAPLPVSPYPSPQERGELPVEVNAEEAAATDDDERSSAGRTVGKQRRDENEVVRGGRGKGRGIGRPVPPMPPWEDERWAETYEAWHGRGLHEPPSSGQLRLLWPVASALPNRIADWINEGPYGDTTHPIVAHVLASAEAVRAAEVQRVAFGALSNDEQAEWFDLEEGLPYWHPNPLRKSRLAETVLPTVADGENPFRVALPAIEQRHLVPARHRCLHQVPPYKSCAAKHQ